MASDMRSAANVQGATTPWRFLEDYQPVVNVFDEMVTPRGVLRPHGEAFVRSLEGLGRLGCFYPPLLEA